MFAIIYKPCPKPEDLVKRQLLSLMLSAHRFFKSITTLTTMYLPLSVRDMPIPESGVSSLNSFVDPSLSILGNSSIETIKGHMFSTSIMQIWLSIFKTRPRAKTTRSAVTVALLAEICCSRRAACGRPAKW